MMVTLESLVPLQADRDELLQLLTLLDTHWHQNEEAFASRSLAEWPQWCEDQGFRACIIMDFIRNLDTLIYSDDQGSWLNQWLAPQNQSLTTDELLRITASQRPLLLENIEVVIRTAEVNSQVLTSIAGGTSKAGRVGIDVSIFAGGFLLGYYGAKGVQKLKRERAEAMDQLRRDTEQKKHELYSQAKEETMRFTDPGLTVVQAIGNDRDQGAQPIITAADALQQRAIREYKQVERQLKDDFYDRLNEFNRTVMDRIDRLKNASSLAESNEDKKLIKECDDYVKMINIKVNRELESQLSNLRIRYNLEDPRATWVPREPLVQTYLGNQELRAEDDVLRQAGQIEMDWFRGELSEAEAHIEQLLRERGEEIRANVIENPIIEDDDW